MRKSIVLLAAAVVLAGAPSARAIPLEKLTASDGAGGDVFSHSAIAISGDTAIIGAFGDADHGSFTGSAYVFVRSGSGWVEQVKLTAPDGAQFDGFGEAVAISGDTVIVGAFGDDDKGSSSGSAYIFTRSGSAWTHQAKLTAADGGPGDFFGHAVAINGDTVVVGASSDDLTQGSAYVFTRSGSDWTQEAKLTASDAASNDHFGNAVAMVGDTAIVGSPNVPGLRAGSAYVFSRSGSAWSQQAKLGAADGFAGDHFGTAVAISGDTVVVSSLTDLFNGSGSAYVFTGSGSTWAQQAKLTADDGSTDDLFGSSASISDHTVIVGAPGTRNDGVRSGSVYVFVRSGSAWTQKPRISATDSAADDEFGNAVAIAGDTAIVGAPFDDDNGPASGSAYVADTSCIEQGLEALDGTPAEGLLSGTIDREIEPVLGQVDSELERELHQLNCSVLVPVESAIDRVGG